MAQWNEQLYEIYFNFSIIADLKRAVYYQKCHDPECRAANFKSSGIDRMLIRTFNMLNNYKYLKQLVEVAIKIICSVQALLFSVQVLVLFLFGSTQKLTNNRYSVKILTDY